MAADTPQDPSSSREDWTDSHRGSSEQEQGLLGGWRESEKDGLSEAHYLRRRPWSRYGTLFIATAAFVLLVMTAGWLLDTGSTAGSHGHDMGAETAHEDAHDMMHQSSSVEHSHSVAQSTTHAVHQISTSSKASISSASATTPASLQQPSASATSAGESVQTNDYLLDSDWDFEAAPQRREYHWTVRDQDHNPDGIYRPMMLINNQFPGPLVEINEGDTIVVHVDNQAVNATAIHWHGIYQNGTPWMDGTVGVTQCAIAPGTSFTYEFTITAQSGTYWWHAHQGVQSSDGLHGPLIVHSKREKELQQLEYATDRVILVSDHYHDLSSALLWQYLKPNNENTEPVPYGALINGRAKRDCADFPERTCDSTTSNVGVPGFHFETGKNHRIRFINVGAFAEFQLQIDEHELAVTEVDGTDVVPTWYHRLHVNPAQRYSVVFTTNNTQAENFWLRARMIKQCFTDPPANLESEVHAIVSYQDDTDSHQHAIPTSTDWDEMIWLQCKDMNTSELVPVDAVAAPAEADAFFYFRSNFEIGANQLSRGFFNQSSWRPNAHSPLLTRAIDGMSTTNASFYAELQNAELQNDDNATPFSSSPKKSSTAFVNTAAFHPDRELVVQTTGKTTTIDIMIHNFDDGNHPIHLHGYKYFVLASGKAYPPLTSVDAGLEITAEHIKPLYDSLDLSNPLRRDTASVAAYSWLMIRVVADNPGVWALHCHVAWHSEAGLMMMLMTRSEDLGEMQVPGDVDGLCSREGVERGMGPEDESFWPDGAAG